MDWEVKILHVFREANRAADGLVNIGCDGHGLKIFDEGPPTQIGQLLADDVRGISFRRHVAV